MTFTFVAAFILTTSFTHVQAKRYKIIGSATGFSDSILLYLDYTTSDGSTKHLDSTHILNGKFIFSGTLKSNAIKAIIRTKDFSDYKFFWLENARISFKAEKGKFRDAVITGSKTQNDANKLDLAIKATKNKKEQYISFIRNHPNSIISANLLSVYGSTWGKDTTSTLYKSLSQLNKNTFYGKNVLEFISLNKNLKVGDKYADFSQKDAQQNTVRLSDFTGKVVLLEFWGSWCTPCRKGNPELVKLYNEFKGKGFEILGVGAETDKDAWLNAIETDKLQWTNVTDFKGDKNEAALIYGVSYYPANFLIDKTGTIIATDLQGDKLRDKLNELL